MSGKVLMQGNSSSGTLTKGRTKKLPMEHNSTSMELDTPKSLRTNSEHRNNNKMAILTGSWHAGSNHRDGRSNGDGSMVTSTSNTRNVNRVLISPHGEDRMESVNASTRPHHYQKPSLPVLHPFSTNNGMPTPQSPHLTACPGKKQVSSSISSSSAKQQLSYSKSTQNSRDPSPSYREHEMRQPDTPTMRTKKVTTKNNGSDTSSGLQTFQTPNSQKDSRGSQPSSASTAGTKLLPFLRKGHRRTKSLEEGGRKSTGVASTAAATPLSPCPTSPLLEPCSKDKAKDSENTDLNKANNGIVQDLMGLKDKFMQLQIPSLAKPSPTSFLTGKGEEVVRTSEYEPSPFQLEIPSLPEVVEIARLNDFVENYRRMDQNFDLGQFIGCHRLELQQVKIKEHIPIAQSLLECGDGLSVQGISTKGGSADDRLEAVVFEGQRYFIVVFRGTTEQQTKILGSSKSKRRASPLNPEQENVEVYGGFKDEYSKLEKDCFDLVDKLSEQNPFCDVVFSGYSFGAAMATLAATRYATARPMMRVGCFTLASPKVGFSLFRHVVNSLSNLKVVRLELGQDAKCQGPTAGGWHVGHSLVLSASFCQHPQLQQHKPVLAYKFDTPKHKKFKTTHPDLRNYVTTLEEMARLNVPWVNDFVNNTGKGVVVNNEARQVV